MKTVFYLVLTVYFSFVSVGYASCDVMWVRAMGTLKPGSPLIVIRWLNVLLVIIVMRCLFVSISLNENYHYAR